MPNDRSEIKSKLFLSTADKDEVSKKRNKEDFELSEDVKENLPKYSPEIVLNSFRERQENADQRFFAKRWEVLKRNIVGQTMWVTISYLLIYYFIQILFVQQTVNTSSWFSRTPSRDGNPTDPSCITDFCKCCNSVNVTTTDFIGTCSDLKTPSFKSHPIVDRCIEAKQIAKLVASYETKQSSITKLLTFFLGFYVSQVMARWWYQVSANPSMDNICLALNGVVFYTSETNNRTTQDEENFKKKIVRYCLLSWTMCLSNFSQCVKDQFKDEKKYIEKGLITQEEYDALSGNTSCISETKMDGWLDKWSLPLTWACQLIKHDFMKKGDKVVPNSTKKIIDGIKEYHDNLLKITTAFENRLPKIQTQAVTFAVFVFIAVGCLAGQGTMNRFDSKQLGWWCILINFPIIELVKYSLIITWMKVAIYLQNPFGRDTGYDVDLIAYLDGEIWKSACMITQSDAPPV